MIFNIRKINRYRTSVYIKLSRVGVLMHYHIMKLLKSLTSLG